MGIPAFALATAVGAFLACGSDDGAPGSGAGPDAASGSDSPAPSAPGADGSLPPGDDGGDDDAAVSSGQTFLYLAARTPQPVIFGFSVDAVTGALSAVDADPAAPGVQPATSAPDYPIALAAHPSGKYLYSASFAARSVSAYAVDAKTGALTRIAADARDGGVTDFALPDNQPVYVVADPKGRCIYVADQQGGSNGHFLAFAVDPATGALSLAREVLTAPVAQFIAVDGDARFAVVGIAGSQLAVHRLDDASGLPIGPDGGAGDGVLYGTPGQSGPVSLDAKGRTLYAPSVFDSSILTFRVDPSTYALSPLTKPTTTSSPVLALVHPTAPFVLVTGNKRTEIYTVEDGGTLTLAAPDAGPVVPVGITAATFDPTGKHLYTSQGSSIGVYGVAGTTLTAQGTTALGAGNTSRNFALIRR